MESRESSSPLVTRAVAAALQGCSVDPYMFPVYQKWLLRLLGGLPQAAARWLIPRVQPSFALDVRQVWDLSVETLASMRLADYASLPGCFPAVTAGLALGGATAHLSTLVGGPFLPQSFVLTLKNGAVDGSTEAYFHLSEGLARRLTDLNRNILTIQHFDPVHDGWLTRRVNHLRIKLLDLPESYCQFLRDRLLPGGEVIYLEGGAQWLRYRISPRNVFQVGGWGDIPAQEFLEGSARIREYRQKEGLRESNWMLPGYELETGPESEWGSEPGFGEALQTFCQREGYQFVRVALPDPNSFSRLAFNAFRYVLEKEGRSPAGIVVEMFSQYDTRAALDCGLLPLWLIFNTTDSLRFLRSMVPEFPSDLPVFFSPLATFSLTPDMAAYQDWAEALHGLRWTNIGSRPDHYPADARALVDWATRLRSWCRDHERPIRTRLSGAELKLLAAQIKN